MILYDRGLQRTRYTVRAGTAGYVVYEGEQPIAYADSDVYARAIAQALNLVQVLTAMRVRVTVPPRRPELN